MLGKVFSSLFLLLAAVDSMDLKGCDDEGKDILTAQEHVKWMQNYLESMITKVQDWLPEEYPEMSPGMVCNGAQTIDYKEFSPKGSFFRVEGLSDITPSEPLFKNGWKPLETCAVVSNAGTMSGSGLGREIDSNDFVIRFNTAKVKGFEEDIGTKTSLRIISPAIISGDFGFLEENSDIFEVIF